MSLCIMSSRSIHIVAGAKHPSCSRLAIVRHVRGGPSLSIHLLMDTWISTSWLRVQVFSVFMETFMQIKKNMLPQYKRGEKQPMRHHGTIVSMAITYIHREKPKRNTTVMSDFHDKVGIGMVSFAPSTSPCFPMFL